MVNLDLANDEAAEELSADEVAIIFGFLCYTDIMHARVCSTWREAAKKTRVPPTEFVVDSVSSFNAMRAMSTALPNLQQISICPLGPGQRFINGEDPDEERAARTANYTIHDINIISNFRKLREMYIYEAQVNGRYPVLFNFPLLRVLSICDCEHIRFDLELLAGLPSLEELNCYNNPRLTGNLNSLRVVKDTLEKVEIAGSEHVSGNFMDLADFPHLRELSLIDTAVTGDIRDISGSDFPALESIYLPLTVAGGVDYEFQHISEVPSFMHTIHLLLQRTQPRLRFDLQTLSLAFYWKLSRDSPDWYEYENIRAYGPAPPFSLQIIRAGSRLGWSWYSSAWNHNLLCEVDLSCEINWLDPKPSRDSDDYAAYMEEMEDIEKDINFSGYYEHPPNEHQYRRLCGEWYLRG